MAGGKQECLALAGLLSDDVKAASRQLRLLGKDGKEAQIICKVARLSLAIASGSGALLKQNNFDETFKRSLENSCI